MLDETRINASPDANGEAEVIEVDLDAVVEVEDATADVNIAAVIAPEGIYPCKWSNADEKGLAAATTKPKGTNPTRHYVGGNIVGRIVANGEPFDDAPVYKYINSLSMRGKPTSDLHHFCNCASSPAPNRSTVRELLAHAEEVLQQNPAVYTHLDWRASYQKDDGTWHEFAKRMDQFPKHFDENGKFDGTYEQQIKSPKDGELINAQLYVRAFYTEAEAKKLMAKAS